MMSVVSNTVKTKNMVGRSSSVPTKRKPKARRKPAWDSTVSDLSTLKLTPEELHRRKKAHESQNLDVVKEERLRQHVARIREKEQSRHVSLSSRGQAALLREILSGNSHFYEAVENSDRLLASVKDLLGGDLKRYPGVPYVTRASTKHSASDRSLPDVADITSKLDLNSESVMDRSALNDLEDEYGGSSDGEDDLESANYEPVMDLVRFKQLIQEVEQSSFTAVDSEALKQSLMLKLAPSRPTGDRKHADMTESISKTGVTGGQRRVLGDGDGPARQQQQQDQVGRSLNEETPVSSPRQAPAINDTQKVNRTRLAVNNGSADRVAEEQSSLAPTMDDFNKVLDVVQCSLGDYERLTGRTQPSSCSSRPTTYSGYTMALLDAVARMSVYFKESEIRYRAESIIKEQLMSDIQRLNNLVDALTTDLLAMQEEYARLQNEYVKHRRDVENQLLMFGQALAAHGIRLQSTAEASAVVIQPTLPQTAQNNALRTTHNYEPTTSAVNCSAVLSSAPLSSVTLHPDVQVQSTEAFNNSSSSSNTSVLRNETRPSVSRPQNSASQQAVDVRSESPLPAPSTGQWPATSRPTASYATPPTAQFGRPTDIGPAGDGFRPRNSQQSVEAFQPGPGGDFVERRSEDVRSMEESLDARREAIRRQMVELDRQRQLAQAKVNELRLQEQQFGQQLGGQKVSPSISPITVQSDLSSVVWKSHNQPAEQSTRPVHSPRISDLESASATAIMAGVASNRQTRVTQPTTVGGNIGNGRSTATTVNGQHSVPRLTGKSNDNMQKPKSNNTQQQQVTTSDGGWFALSSHVSS